MFQNQGDVWLANIDPYCFLYICTDYSFDYWGGGGGKHTHSPTLRQRFVLNAVVFKSSMEHTVSIPTERANTCLHAVFQSYAS